MIATAHLSTPSSRHLQLVAIFKQKSRQRRSSRELRISTTRRYRGASARSSAAFRMVRIVSQAQVNKVIPSNCFCLTLRLSEFKCVELLHCRCHQCWVMAWMRSPNFQHCLSTLSFWDVIVRILAGVANSHSLATEELFCLELLDVCLAAQQSWPEPHATPRCRRLYAIDDPAQPEATDNSAAAPDTEYMSRLNSSASHVSRDLFKFVMPCNLQQPYLMGK